MAERVVLNPAPYTSAAAVVLRPTHKWLIVLLLSMQVWLCWTARGPSLHGETDFRAFYSAGTALRSGHGRDLYDYAEQERTQRAIFGPGGRTLPFLYPAFAALPFTVLAHLHYIPAFLVLFAINLLCLLLSARLMLRDRVSAGLTPAWLCALFLCSLPAAMVLMQGQVTCLLLLLYTAVHALERRQQEFLAGACLALGLVKFQLVLPVVLLFLLWRQFRLVAGFLLGGGVLGVVSLGLTGVAGAQNYFHLLRGVGSATLLAPGLAQVRYGMQAAMEPNLHGAVLALTGAGGLGAGLTLLCSAGALAFGWHRQQPSLVASLPLVMLVSYHMQPYDLLLLVLPLTVQWIDLAGKPSHTSEAKRKVWVLRASTAMLIAPVAPWLLAEGYTCWLVLAVVGVSAGAGRWQPASPSFPAIARRSRQLNLPEAYTPAPRMQL